MMSELDRPWTQIGWMSFAGIVVVSSLLGFVVLSRYRPNAEPLDVWGAICRGLGISFDAAASGGAQPPLQTPTEIAWTQATIERIRSGNADRGQQIAAACEACHGGSAPNPGHLIPTLDGMNAAALFKQLVDYRSGKRLWSVMNGMANSLSVQDAADVAAYFAARAGRLQPAGDDHAPPGGHGLRQSDPGARLAFAGDPHRGIPPCSACHGPGGYKTGAPPLAGQHAEYIERQLGSFAQGIRHNDIYEQMRAIARQLTPDEMQAVAAFYGERSAKVAATE
jgi:cytochrome c553